jgi:hypothetical protein
MQLMTKKTNISVVYKNESRSIIYSRSLINTNVVYETSTTVSVTGMGSVVISLYRTLKKHQEIYIGIHKNDVNKCRTTCNRNLVSNNIVLYVVDANIWKRICAGILIVCIYSVLPLEIQLSRGMLGCH